MTSGASHMVVVNLTGSVEGFRIDIRPAGT